MVEPLKRLAAGLGCIEMADFWKLRSHELPPTGGVYVLEARVGTRFRYPGGISPVFFIGKSRNLRTSLMTVLCYAEQLREDPRLESTGPASEYAAVFCGKYGIVPLPSEPLTPEELYQQATQDFLRLFKSLPSANQPLPPRLSSGLWRRPPLG